MNPGLQRTLCLIRKLRAAEAILLLLLLFGQPALANVIFFDDFEGGSTSFRDDDVLYRESSFGLLSVTPEKGMALLFHHPIVQRGDMVTEGRKYVLRTDVMYERI